MQRNYLAALIAGLTVLSVLLVGAMAGFGTAGADVTGEQHADRSITVSATGEADAAPDKAVVRLAVTSEGDDLAQIRDNLSTGAQDLRGSLDELGVDYETSEYSIRERRDEFPTYRGSHGFVVTLGNPDDVGSIIDAAADAGVEVKHVQLTLSEEKRAQLRDDAIESAMDDARHQAETIAGTSNLTVTTVVNVDATQRHFSPVAFDGAAMETAAPKTNIDSGDVSVGYNVDVTFNATSN